MKWAWAASAQRTNRVSGYDWSRTPVVLSESFARNAPVSSRPLGCLYFVQFGEMMASMMIYHVSNSTSKSLVTDDILTYDMGIDIERFMLPSKSPNTSPKYSRDPLY
ncbi:hypothetical protein N7539_004260 [Penicillium diatomitis]|uniref:Uncharacterized protein n=1 Tax=Penicillium diatomitis TaxID=2819901 RepID=A0A9X0BY30_9EURO|nr:uncharacterized protein N7539_004260 [Penicillium diatomitis]KAJ5489370.1 hypothetical protein N7539_004260 [Penicillium diatomitis]